MICFVIWYLVSCFVGSILFIVWSLGGVWREERFCVRMVEEKWFKVVMGNLEK